MSFQSGQRLGAYEILEKIGSGGMGDVYKARDVRRDRTVAVKVLGSELAKTPTRRERLKREVSGDRYAVTSDGQRFLIIEEPQTRPDHRYTVLMDWRKALDSR